MEKTNRYISAVTLAITVIILFLSLTEAWPTIGVYKEEVLKCKNGSGYHFRINITNQGQSLIFMNEVTIKDSQGNTFDTKSELFTKELSFPNRLPPESSAYFSATIKMSPTSQPKGSLALVYNYSFFFNLFTKEEKYKIASQRADGTWTFNKEIPKGMVSGSC